jgi:hypothetical protein
MRCSDIARRWGLAAAAVLTVAVMCTPGSAIAQDGAGSGETAAGKASEPKKPRGRLPAYYGQVVDEKQREAIYAIQADYAGRISALQAQLDALIGERDQKVEGVLTPEQLQKVKELREKAKAAQTSRRTAEKSAASEKTSDAPPSPNTNDPSGG